MVPSVTSILIAMRIETGWTSPHPFCNSKLGPHNVPVAHTEWEMAHMVRVYRPHSDWITLSSLLPHIDHYKKVVFAWNTFGVPGSSRAMSVANIECIIRSHSMDNTKVHPICVTS